MKLILWMSMIVLLLFSWDTLALTENMTNQTNQTSKTNKTASVKYLVKTPAGNRAVDFADANLNEPGRIPKNMERDRILRPVRIIPNESPCNYKAFLDFFHDVQASNTTNLEVLLKSTIRYKDGSEFYYYNPEDLCITVEDDLVIDIFKYDCSQADVCICGLYMGYVDLNIDQPDEINGERIYIAVNGLDRKLIEEDGLCVSGLKGHCTLENSTALEKLDCSTLYECVLDDSYGPILRNKKTTEIYGICLPKPYKVGIDENNIIYEKINNGISYVPSLELITICMVLQESLRLTLF